MSKFDVIGLGSVLVDELCLLSDFPQEDTKIEILQTQKQLGGPVPIALKMLSKLGLKTSFISNIGDDQNGDFIQSELKRCNIDASLITQEKQKCSGHSQVWISQKTKSRTIAYSSGSLSSIDPLDIPFTPKLIHIDGRNHTAAKDIIAQLKPKGTLVSIDTGNYREQTLRLLDFVDVAIMPRRFAIDFLGEFTDNDLIKKIHKLYPHIKLITITDGVNGSISHFNENIYCQKAFTVETINSTGAGDIHSAAIIYGILQEWDITKTLEFAAATAALKCTSLGNINLPSYEDINNFLTKKSALLK